MKWFCANLIFVIKFGDKQDFFPFFETSFLIFARDFDHAIQESENLGRLEQQAGEEIEFQGRSARKEFIGISQIKLTHNLEEDDEIGSARPNHGTELNEFQYQSQNFSEIENIISGKNGIITRINED